MSPMQWTAAQLTSRPSLPGTPDPNASHPVLVAIGRAWRSPEEVARQTNLTSHHVRKLIVRFELAGLVEVIRPANRKLGIKARRKP